MSIERNYEYKIKNVPINKIIGTFNATNGYRSLDTYSWKEYKDSIQYSNIDLQKDIILDKWNEQYNFKEGEDLSLPKYYNGLGAIEILNETYNYNQINTSNFFWNDMSQDCKTFYLYGRNHFLGEQFYNQNLEIGLNITSIKLKSTSTNTQITISTGMQYYGNESLTYKNDYVEITLHLKDENDNFCFYFTVTALGVYKFQETAVTAKIEKSKSLCKREYNLPLDKYTTIVSCTEPKEYTINYNSNTGELTIANKIYTLTSPIVILIIQAAGGGGALSGRTIYNLFDKIQQYGSGGNAGNSIVLTLDFSKIDTINIINGSGGKKGYFDKIQIEAIDGKDSIIEAYSNKVQKINITIKGGNKGHSYLAQFNNVSQKYKSFTSHSYLNWMNSSNIYSVYSSINCLIYNEFYGCQGGWEDIDYYQAHYNGSFFSHTIQYDGSLYDSNIPNAKDIKDSSGGYAFPFDNEWGVAGSVNSENSSSPGSFGCGGGGAGHLLQQLDKEREEIWIDGTDGGNGWFKIFFNGTEKN